jgi:hypothetical protein
MNKTQVYLVYNIDLKYMDSFLEKIFASYDEALAYQVASKEKLSIQIWEVE